MLPEARRSPGASLESDNWDLVGELAPDGIHDAPIAIHHNAVPYVQYDDTNQRPDMTWVVYSPPGANVDIV